MGSLPLQMKLKIAFMRHKEGERKGWVEGGGGEIETK